MVICLSRNLRKFFTFIYESILINFFMKTNIMNTQILKVTKGHFYAYFNLNVSSSTSHKKTLKLWENLKLRKFSFFLSSFYFKLTSYKYQRVLCTKKQLLKARFKDSNINQTQIWYSISLPPHNTNF